MSVQVKSERGWIAGVFAAAAASLCCITPVIAFIAGLSGAVSSLSWMAPYRPCFITATVLIFSFVWYQKLKPQKMVDCNCETDEKKSFLGSKTFLGIITIVAALLIAFPYYASVFYPGPSKANLSAGIPNQQTVQLNISGMDCEACTNHINSEITKLNGVISSSTSFEKANSIIKFDSSKINAGRIASAVSAIGYKVTGIITKN